ncbi:MAG: cupin domain-containing protein [Nitrospirota bacterium]
MITVHKRTVKVLGNLLIMIVMLSLSMTVAGAEKNGQAAAAKKGKMKALQPGVYHVEDILKKGLEQKSVDFNYTVLADTKTGSVELFQIGNVRKHFHPKENHFLYILKGRAKGQIGDVTAEVGPGDLVVIPAGKKYQHSFTKLSDEPVVFILFSSPPFRAGDTVWTEK